MDLNQLRNEVKDLAKKAVDLDKMENYEEAADYYVKAAKKLNVLMKHDENKYSHEVYKQKLKEYCERAKILQDSKPKKKEKTDGNGGKKDDEEDGDSKLKDSLSGCLVTETPNVKWSDVAGLEKAKEALKEAVVLPIKFPQLFQGKRKPWKGILLYGPPGTGKSYLAKAAATETGGKFFSVSAANIVSKWMGESERLVKALFDLARQNKPAVIFFDEIDSVMSARGENDNDATRRLKTEFLVQMQGVGKDDDGILVLGATNIPWALDPAVRRRFQKKIYISLPELEARKTIFKLNLENTPNTLKEEQFDDLADRTEGYSGSDIATLTQDAVYEPLRKCEAAKYFKKGYMGNDFNYYVAEANEQHAFPATMHDLDKPELLVPPEVCYDDYIIAIQKIKATVNTADLYKQQQFTDEFGQEG